MPTLSDDDEVPSTEVDRLQQRQSTSINAVQTFRVLTCFRPWDQSFKCPKIDPNPLIDQELNSMWIVYLNLWRWAGNWNHVNYQSQKVVLALLVMASTGQPLYPLANGMTIEQQETLALSSGGTALLAVCRAKIDLVVLGQCDLDQFRIVFGQHNSIDQLLALTTDHNVEDLVLQTLFRQTFKSQDSHVCINVAHRLRSHGWTSPEFDARPALTVPYRLRVIMDPIPSNTIECVLDDEHPHSANVNTTTTQHQ